MDSREEQPRISVGTVQDWDKMRSNYRDAVLSSLRGQIAQNSLKSEQDALLAHIDQFIDRSLSLAQPNLRVNGQNFESLATTVSETEQFDETLDRRIWSLADNRLQWHKRIAETRRTVPLEVEATITSLLQQHRILDTTNYPMPSDDSAEEEPLSEADLAYQQRVEEALQKTVSLASELDQTISQQQERGERVQVIAKDIKTLKP